MRCDSSLALPAFKKKEDIFQVTLGGKIPAQEISGKKKGTGQYYYVPPFFCFFCMNVFKHADFFLQYSTAVVVVAVVKKSRGCLVVDYDTFGITRYKQCAIDF